MGLDSPAKTLALDGNAAIVRRSLNQSSGWPRHHKSIGQGPQVKQGSGDQSVNLQAGGNIAIGVTYDDARQIALDVYKANAVELAAAAKQAAIARAEEITDKFLEELKDKNPLAVSQAARPDFQIALLEAQKAYAKTGDKDLATVLVDLLVSRTKQEPRSLREIVLAESLQVVPRLTMSQIHTISVIFLLRHTENRLVTKIEHLGQWFDRYMTPLVSSLSKADSLYRHLVYSGAATQELTSINLAAAFKAIYVGLFTKGFDATNMNDLTDKYPKLKKMFQDAPIENRMMLPPVTIGLLEKLLESAGVHEKSDVDRLMNAQKSDLLGDADVLQNLIDTRKGFETLADVWDNSSLRSMALTSVGMAIGHANFQRLSGDQAPLSIWIPD
jgi:hypothetical protein